MRFKIQGKDITELFDMCPLSEVCHTPRGCSDWEKKHYDSCPHFRHYSGTPKVVAYIVERATRKV